MMKMAGLIADIGATNARFAIADPDGIHAEKVLKCQNYPGVVEAVSDYLQGIGERDIDRASFAVAGPVTGDVFEMTNHPWSFSISETMTTLGLETLRIMNDFEAVALAVPYLEEGIDFRQVGEGSPRPEASIGIIGPGTGLGVASLVWDGRAYRPVPGEGGHVTMPAKTPREFALFQWLLHHKYSHLSAERVCSGKGLVNIYNALRGMDKQEDLPDLEPEQISRRALDKSCPLCGEALDLMMGFLGTVAGNLALTIGAHGGIYIAGGIPAKLGPYFDRSRFREEFVAKGRFAEYLAPIPTYVILNEFPAFIGLHADLVGKSAS